MSKLSKNTRKHKRLKSFFLLKYQTDAKAGQEQITNVHDISAGGLRFQTNQRLPQNCIIKLAILIPSFEEPIEAEAEVVWVGQTRKKNMPYAVAVKFTKVSGKAEKELEEFLQKMAKEKKNPFFIDLPQFSVRKK